MSDLGPEEQHRIVREQLAARRSRRAYGTLAYPLTALVLIAAATLFIRSRSTEAEAPAPAGSTIFGTVIIDNPNAYNGMSTVAGGPCSGASISDDYGDLRPRAIVTVRNEEGEIIATGALGEGKWLPRACVMDFEVANVPKAKFYAIEVTDHGQQRYSSDELERRGGRVEMTIKS